LLLEYALGEERSYLWAVTKTDKFSYELPARKEIEDVAKDLYRLLSASQLTGDETFQERRERLLRTETQQAEVIDRLSSLVLGPVAYILGNKRLIIVPDGALQYVPFQILTAPNLSSNSAAEPLVVRNEIVNEPSASILALVLNETKNRPQATNSVAVLADPVFEANDPRVSSTSVFRTAVQGSKETDVQRALRDVGLSGEGLQIPRLMSSREEADSIIKVVPWGTALEALGFDASRTTVGTAELGRYRIVHFATHGLLNNEHPDLSGIVLSLVDHEGRPQDGFLRVHDIYGLDLPVDLVVLSACISGLGKDVRGEGLIGLTRGFMYAGASGVVASLWRVDDEATAELMKQFYIGMFERKLKPAAALREAQILMSKQQRWHAAYYWAAFIIQGRYNQNISGSSSSSSYAIGWLSLGILGLATLAFLVMKRRRGMVL